MKLLHQTRMGDNVTFALKDIRNNTIRDVKDPTSITSKTRELFCTRSFEDLYNGVYQSTTQSKTSAACGGPWNFATGPGSRC